MRQMIGLGIALGVLGLVAAPAHAQVKGAGKLGITVMRVDPSTGQGTANAKAGGAMAVKPVATIAGKAPTGGALTSFKLAKDLSALLPGFPAGNYVIEFETAQTSTGDTAGANGISTFATLTVDALGKCTIHAHTSVKDTNNGGPLTPGDPNAANDAVGKCTITTYQIAGSTNYLLAPGTAQPTAQRVRIRQLVNAADCKTGDVMIGGSALIGATTCHDPANKVFGVVGVANGQVN
jgi:hypothetical protein